MKKFTLLTTLLAITYATPALSVDITGALKDPLSKTKTVKPTTNALSHYAATQLGLSEESVNLGIGALLKVAKDHISEDNFSKIASALPNTDSYIKNAPTISKSSLTSMLGGSNKTGKKAASLGYIDKAFESIGISKEQAPLLINSLVGYLSNNGFSKEAEMLKKGLSFL